MVVKESIARFYAFLTRGHIIIGYDPILTNFRLEICKVVSRCIRWCLILFILKSQRIRRNLKMCFMGSRHGCGLISPIFTQLQRNVRIRLSSWIWLKLVEQARRYGILSKVRCSILMPAPMKPFHATLGMISQ